MTCSLTLTPSPLTLTPLTLTKVNTQVPPDLFIDHPTHRQATNTVVQSHAWVSSDL